METLFIGKSAIFLPETDSTNSHAQGLLKNVNPPEGTVVYSFRQTNGRGQRGSAWISEPDVNLAASFILRPDFLFASEQFFLYQILGLACRDAISDLIGSRQAAVKIKWPNDILVEGRKVCGILIENSILGNEMKYSVAGVGINVNQTDFPALLNAGSLKQITGEIMPLAKVLQCLCGYVEKYYLLLKRQKNTITKKYESELYGLNQILPFEIGGRINNLSVRGVGDSGLLVLEDEMGSRMEVDVKQVKWLHASEVQ